MINPRELTIGSTSGGTATVVSLIDMFAPIAATDAALKAAFDSGVKTLDNQVPREDLQQAIIDSIARKYVGEDVSGIVDGDKRLLIKYYEMLYPDDAKKLNGFMSGIIADGVHGAYVMNIKYLSYVSPEPYKSIFFNYIGDYKIFAYNVKDTAMFLSPSIPKQVVVLFFPLMSSFPFQGGIILSQLDPNNKHYLSTFFHECGHAVGEYSGVLPFLKWNAAPELQNALLKDMSNYVVPIIRDKEKRALTNEELSAIYYSIMNIGVTQLDKTRNTLQSFGIYGLSPELQTIRDEVIFEINKELKNKDNTIVRDVLGGFSGNLLIEGLGGGHSDSYWPWLSGLGNIKDTFTSNGMQKMEFFAHYFSANMRNDILEIEKLERFFPGACKEIDKMIGEMAGSNK